MGLKSSKKILVTGATGFVGNVLLEELPGSSPQSRISVFVLPGDPFRKSLSRHRGLRIIEGNITHRQDVMDAVSGHTHVIHLAGLISYAKSDRRRLMEVNAAGVKNIVDACLNHHVRKLVHISTVGACGFLRDGTLTDEEEPFNWPPNFHYMVSKHEGQSIVEEAIQARGLKAVILNPASVMGPGDPNPQTPHNQLYSRIYGKKLFACFSGGLSVVDVRDLVQLIIKALNSDMDGRKYFVVGANAEYSRIVRLIGRQAKKRVHPFPVPSFFLVLAGGMLERIGQITKRKPVLTSAYGRLSGWKVYHSSEKSRKDFNHQYIPLEKTIEDGCRYFEEKFL